MKASSLRLFVYDLPAARHFYGHVLGLRESAGDAARGWAVFDAGALTLVVETVPPDAPEEDHALVGRFTGLSLAVDDITAEHRRLLAAGVFFSGAPERQPWGGVLATFVDPAENQLQLVQLPPAGAR